MSVLLRCGSCGDERSDVMLGQMCQQCRSDGYRFPRQPVKQFPPLAGKPRVKPSERAP